MRNLLLIIVFIACSIFASAQKVYFIYLQSDNASSFYVKMSDKIYSSTASGYLILSNLVDSTYNFSIGFPSLQSESKFAVVLGGEDKGFLIKNFNSVLGLFDLQNLTITKALPDESVKNISYIRRNDDFSSLLSRAAKDTTLLYATVRVKENDVVVKKEESKTDEPKQTTIDEVMSKDTSTVRSTPPTVAEISKPDSILVSPVPDEKKESGVINTLIKEDPKRDNIPPVEKNNQLQAVDTTAVVMIDTLSNTIDKQTIKNITTEESPVFKRSRIKKYSESSTSEGFGLVYYDVYDDVQDTIRLLIPNPPITFRQTERDTSLVQKDFIHVDELKNDTVEQTPIVVAVKSNTRIKSQCKSIASNNDFFKLRKNMASENTDEAMVAEAKKFFKSKCFTTENIKNLSALFLTSAGKYQFFDAAYLHVSDQENFSTLEAEIKDDYYLKRFKALIGD